MQMSESKKSMQSGADSRLSRRSQRPLKLINKKIIGNDSFVATMGGNEADFAESEQKKDGLTRVPPDFNPKPSQSAQAALVWPQQALQMIKSQEGKKPDKEMKRRPE